MPLFSDTKGRCEATRLYNDFHERVQSLVEDGYLIRHIYSGNDYFFTSLKHRTNGNRITISARLRDKLICQKTNGIVTHQQVYT